MKLIIDTNVLVGQLLREKGQKLLASDNFVLFISNKVFDECVYEINKRLRVMFDKGHITMENLEIRHRTALLIFNEVTTVVPVDSYLCYEEEAKTRMHKDLDDWETVALALYLELQIWTEDKDFFGCGIATWSTDTLIKYHKII